MTNPVQHKSNLVGIGYLILGAGSFVLNDAMMKYVMSDAPPFQVLVMRGLFGCLWLLPMLGYMGQLNALPQAFNRFVIARAVLEVGSIVSFILALANAPIADVTAIFQTTPMLIVLGMALFHGEKIGRVRMGLIALGFAGALLVAQPGSDGASPFASLAFITAFFAAIRDLVGRRIPTQTPVFVSTFVTVVVVMVASALIGLQFETWITPTQNHYILMIVAGLLMSFGHVFTFLAYKNADAQAVAPFYYSFMIWALIMGIVVFGAYPNALAIGGMLLILTSGLAVIYLERRKSANLP